MLSYLVKLFQYKWRLPETPDRSTAGQVFMGLWCGWMVSGGVGDESDDLWHWAYLLWKLLKAHLWTYAQKRLLQDTEGLNKVGLFCLFVCLCICLFKAGSFLVAHVCLKLTDLIHPYDLAFWITGTICICPYSDLIYTVDSDVKCTIHGPPVATWSQAWQCVWINTSL